MNSNKLQSLLVFHWNMLKQSLPSFQRSLEKCRAVDLSQPISFESEESLDALSSKYARVSDIHTQKVIKTLLLLLREEAPTFLDRMHLCEKLCIIPDADEMISIRDLRNVIAHEYLNDNLIEIYREILSLSVNLLQSIDQTEKFLIEKGFLSCVGNGGRN